VFLSFSSGPIRRANYAQGGRILAALLALPAVSSVYTITRREPKETSPKLQRTVEADNARWAFSLSAIKPTPPIYFTALGTTRGQAGSFENQYKIDYELNLELAKAAKESGVKVVVLISSAGANATSIMGYPKMKGELEEAVKALDFDHTVILRPGLIVGTREDSRAPEAVLRGLANFLGGISSSLKDVWAQDADTIGKAAVSAGLKALEGGDVPKVWLVGQPEILRLGRTEWKD
jgi:uncharacterized protein YbjT (DUF2867 family)